jgi:hypothetical protein
MGIMDEFDTGPAEGLKPIKMRDPNSLKLSPQELIMLSHFVVSPLYQIFQKLSEGIIEESETKHFKLYKEPTAFDRTGLIAVAQRLFYEELQAKMKWQVDEFNADMDFARAQKKALLASPEELIVQEFNSHQGEEL